MISIESLTGGELTGNGLYDELMRTTHSHLLQEFKAQRITSGEYSQVYLGSMSIMLQNAVQYLLQFELSNKQQELISSQVEAQNKQNELLDLQKEQLRLANDAAILQNTQLFPEQLKQAQFQNQILGQQVKQAAVNLSLLQKQLELAQINLLIGNEQLKTAQAQNSTPTGGLNLAAFNKTQAEIDLLLQKKVTEMAQTQSVINGNKVTGLVGQETLLKETQTASFLRNAEVQVAKLFTDVYSVMYSTEGEGLNPDRFGFRSENINSVMSKVAQGIKASFSPPTA